MTGNKPASLRNSFEIQSAQWFQKHLTESNVPVHFQIIFVFESALNPGNEGMNLSIHLQKTGHIKKFVKKHDKT